MYVYIFTYLNSIEKSGRLPRSQNHDIFNIVAKDMDNRTRTWSVVKEKPNIQIWCFPSYA